jgi:hypothetical protein
MLVPEVTLEGDIATICWCQFPAAPQAWQLTTQCTIKDGGATPTGSTCNAVMLTVNTKDLQAIIEKANTAAQGTPLGNTASGQNNVSNTVRIEVHGDMIADAKGNGLDGNQLPPFLPTKPTGDGIPGGLFESWFHVET